jgi:hypothetical protein
VAWLLPFSTPQIQRLYVFCFPCTVAVTNLGLWTTWQAGGPLPRCSKQLILWSWIRATTDCWESYTLHNFKSSITGSEDRCTLLSERNWWFSRLTIPVWVPWAMLCLPTSLSILESSVLLIVAIQMGMKWFVLLWFLELDCWWHCTLVICSLPWSWTVRVNVCVPLKLLCWNPPLPPM